MFCDTHFHLHHIIVDRLVNGHDLFESLALKNVPFLLDIGTFSDDLPKRFELAQSIIQSLTDESKIKITDALYFSAGIWPHPIAIKDRVCQVNELKKQIIDFSSKNNFSKKLCALGECGLDHHWNSPKEQNRDDDFFDSNLLAGESELFCMQLDLAREMKLPVIVHSRDAFEGTLNCISDVGYDNGIIHCYSYGIDQARAFLDRGWFISLAGSITYEKKSKIEGMRSLINFIPRDRLLLETDAPYLAPVPYRGQVNTPLLISNTYEFVASALGIPVVNLQKIVLENINKLFFLDKS